MNACWPKQLKAWSINPHSTVFSLTRFIQNSLQSAVLGFMFLCLCLFWTDYLKLQDDKLPSCKTLTMNWWKVGLSFGSSSMWYDHICEWGIWCHLIVSLDFDSQGPWSVLFLWFMIPILDDYLSFSMKIHPSFFLSLKGWEGLRQLGPQREFWI